MLPMLHKHTVIMAALVATLGISACGKKTEALVSNNPSGSNTNTPADNSKPSDPSNGNDGQDDCIEDSGSTSNSKSAGGDALSDLPDPTAGGDTCYKPSPIPDIPPVDSGEAPPVMPPPIDSDLMPSQNETISAGYNPLDVKNVFLDKYGKRLTGGMTAEGLLYTSSSTDNLLDVLRTNYTNNVNLASNVVSAMISSENNKIVVTLKVKENSRVKVYNLVGYLGLGESLTNLKSARSGNGLSTSGQHSIEGTLSCLDFDGGCETSLVRVKIGSSTAHVVFRNSDMNSYFSLPAVGSTSGNPEFERLQSMAINSITKAMSEPNQLRLARMSSWEVANGRSGFNVALMTYENELIAFAGPLLAPRSGTAVNVNLAIAGQDSDDTLDILSERGTRLKMAQTLGEARMIANNSLGQVRVLLKMRKRKGYTQDQMEITFMRRVKPLAQLSIRNRK